MHGAGCDRLTTGRWALVAFGIAVAAGSVLAGLR